MPTYKCHEAAVSHVVSQLESQLWLKVNLKLTHYPACARRIDPQTLLSNNLLKTQGLLFQIRFARVISVFPPSCYILRRLKKKTCKCSRAQEFISESNDNPLKIFKNFSTFAAKGSGDYKIVGGQTEDSFCTFCNQKYNVVKVNYSPC